jgi:hypothetical protein
LLNSAKTLVKNGCKVFIAADDVLANEFLIWLKNTPVLPKSTLIADLALELIVPVRKNPEIRKNQSQLLR